MVEWINKQRYKESGYFLNVKIKLSSIADGNSVDKHLEVKCIGDGLYVSATNENTIRFWDLEKEKNYAVNLPNGTTISTSNLQESDIITSIDYQAPKQTLAVCVGTRVRLKKYFSSYL